jgi:hypothetical protein
MRKTNPHCPAEPETLTKLINSLCPAELETLTKLCLVRVSCRKHPFQARPSSPHKLRQRNLPPQQRPHPTNLPPNHNRTPSKTTTKSFKNHNITFFNLPFLQNRIESKRN